VAGILVFQSYSRLRGPVGSRRVKVVLSRANSGEDDPVLGRFLRFLARDIETNPQCIEAIGSDLAGRVNSRSQILRSTLMRR
jgi:prlF antitoxin for toxin YhaV_toxin